MQCAPSLLSIRERGSAPKRGRHSTIFFPPNASVQWQPDDLTNRTRKWFLGARFLGAPPISLTVSHNDNDNNDNYTTTTNNNDNDNRLLNTTATTTNDTKYVMRA